jgi:hypothetical protein
MNQEHPTHHKRYVESMVAGIVVSLGGVLFCAGAVEFLPGEPGLFRVVKALTIAAGALVAILGFGYAAARKMLHIWLTCPTCQVFVRQASLDERAAYYPCGQCGVTWTCPCTASTD